MKCKFYNPCHKGMGTPQGEENVLCEIQRRHSNCCIYRYLKNSEIKNPNILGKEVSNLFNVEIPLPNISEKVGEHKWH